MLCDGGRRDKWQTFKNKQQVAVYTQHSIDGWNSRVDTNENVSESERDNEAQIQGETM